jgi:hypothetical protein
MGPHARFNTVLSVAAKPVSRRVGVGYKHQGAIVLRRELKFLDVRPEDVRTELRQELPLHPVIDAHRAFRRDNAAIKVLDPIHGP